MKINVTHGDKNYKGEGVDTLVPNEIVPAALFPKKGNAMLLNIKIGAEGQATVSSNFDEIVYKTPEFAINMLTGTKSRPGQKQRIKFDEI